MFVFGTRDFWRELNVPIDLKSQQFVGLLGNVEKTIVPNEEALDYLLPLSRHFQEKMLDRFQRLDTRSMLLKIIKIVDEVGHFHNRQKEARAKLVSLNISDGSIVGTYEENRNISRNIIDSANIWIENCILHPNLSIDYIHDQDAAFDNIDYELLIDIYLYGIISQSISLLSLSKNNDGCQNLYYGVKVSPEKEIPLEVLREHPIVYFNTLLAGNQNNLSETALDEKANSTDFGIGFKRAYDIEFLLFLATLKYFQKMVLDEGKNALAVIDLEQFKGLVGHATTPVIDPEQFIESFVLNQDKIKGQLRKADPIIWTVGNNRHRYELCPFLLIDKTVYISYQALEQSMQIWVSLFSNGGMCYTNIKDVLTDAIEKRNHELSNDLVEILRDKLERHHRDSFIRTDVLYDEIYGKREINYGDFDLILYDPATNELFLIEAKFFSDSLNPSAIINDYEKLFGIDSYYSRCRRRYDLVSNEFQPMREYVGAKDGTIDVHFLFVSSKPLEIELQDTDGIVTFLCLNNFEKYLEKKLINPDNDSVVYPVHRI